MGVSWRLSASKSFNSNWLAAATAKVRERKDQAACCHTCFGGSLCFSFRPLKHLFAALYLSSVFCFFLLLWTPPPRLLSPAIPWELISFLALLPHSLCASKAEPDVCFFIFVSCVAIGFAWFHSSLIPARCKRRGHSEQSRRPVFWNLIGCWQLRPRECQQDFFICARNSFGLVLLLWRYAVFYIKPSCYSYLTILL